MVTRPWEESLPSCLLGASIHQCRLQVLSEPCWIVTHHTTLKPNLWWISRDKVKALMLPHNSNSPPNIDDFLIKKILHFHENEEQAMTGIQLSHTRSNSKTTMLSLLHVTSLITSDKCIFAHLFNI